MSEDEKRYIDPELEKFLKENKEMMKRLFSEEREMVESFFKEEKEYFKGTFDEEQKKTEEFFKEQRKKAKETGEEVFKAFADPEVQKHFMKMGMEFMMGMSALISAMPFPDIVKDMAGKAEKAGKSADNARSGSRPEKIEIEITPKKDSKDEE